MSADQITAYMTREFQSVSTDKLMQIAVDSGLSIDSMQRAEIIDALIAQEQYCAFH